MLPIKTFKLSVTFVRFTKTINVTFVSLRENRKRNVCIATRKPLTLLLYRYAETINVTFVLLRENH